MAETIKVLVSEEEVDARIEALGKQISDWNVESNRLCGGLTF